MTILPFPVASAFPTISGARNAAGERHTGRVVTDTGSGDIRDGDSAGYQGRSPTLEAQRGQESEIPASEESSTGESIEDVRYAKACRDIESAIEDIHTLTLRTIRRVKAEARRHEILDESGFSSGAGVAGE